MHPQIKLTYNMPILVKFSFLVQSVAVVEIRLVALPLYSQILTSNDRLILTSIMVGYCTLKLFQTI